MKYLALAYYSFVTIDDPHLEVQKHKSFFEKRDVAGRIYISCDGINGQMSGAFHDVLDYIAWMRQDSRFAPMPFKKHKVQENIFPRMTVKYRKQLVAFDEEVDMSKRGQHLCCDEWRQELEKGEALVLDVRNEYEWRVGHFQGAVLPPCNTFREFPEYADELMAQVGPKKKVMMYCTGGIRCEIYSAYLRQKGFEEVYQLEGGVIQYGLSQGTAHWEGKLFVFDDRLTITPGEEEPLAVSHCALCKLSCDTYLNCANMDCNELFLCCNNCAQDYAGCCSRPCSASDRLRPYHKDQPHRPFRRKHLQNALEFG